MSTRIRRRGTAALACGLLATLALAQSPEPLPSSLSGRWTAIPPGGRTIIDVWSVRFEGSTPPGPIKARVTWRGRGCGAQDEPAEGTWDGSELRLRFVVRPNVTTQLMHATYCGDGQAQLVVRRKPGTRDFEGEAGLVNSGTPVQVTASP